MERPILFVALIIRKAGILTTVQDLGRVGSRRLGINPGGVMDTAAARIANILLGNVEGAPVLELHFPAAEVEFDEETVFVIAGADFDPCLDTVPIPNWTTMRPQKGGTLSFQERRSGSRAYLAVKGGLKVTEWLGSTSTNLAAGVGGLSGRKLIAGDRLECAAGGRAPQLTAGPSIVPRYSRFPTVRIIQGNEFEYLTATSERDFLRSGFTLTNACDRMGYRLGGKPLHLLHNLGMISAAVTFGSIQLLPDGQLIVLMADHQTSGGYPRLGTVVPADLPVLAQCGPGDGLSFEIVNIEEAERLVAQFEHELSLLRVACSLQRENA